MIYTKMRGKVRVVENCGLHKPNGLRYPVRLLKLEWLSDDDKSEPTGEFRYYFMDYLRADGAWEEIVEAVDAAPVVELKGKELQKAIKEAS